MTESQLDLLFQYIDRRIEEALREDKPGRDGYCPGLHEAHEERMRLDKKLRAAFIG